MDSDGDEEPVKAQGLALTRSRREKKDKTGRLSALQKLKELKSTGQRIKYEVSNIENVYDEVAESDYCDKVQSRLDDDWIEDDGAGDYVEDGREIFDDEPEISKQQVKNADKKSSKSLGKKKIKVVKSSDIKNMLLLAGSKKKQEKNVDLSKDELLGDILQEMNTQTSDPLFVPRAQVVVKKKKKLPITPDTLGLASPSYTSSAPSITTPPSSLPRRRMKPRNIVQPAPLSVELPAGFMSDEPVTPPAKRSKVDARPVRQEQELNKTLRATDEDLPKVKVEPMADDELMDLDPAEFDDDMTDLVQNEKATAFKQEAPKLVTFAEKLSSLGWETIKKDAKPVIDSDIAIDSSCLPTITNTDGDQVFRFYWIDAYEEQYKNPGVVYLFGKVYVESAKSHVSCCVTVKNIERKIYLLPRDQHRKTGEEISPQDVYQEFDMEVADKFRIMKFKTKVVEKKYAFGVQNVPHQAQYLEISYPAEHGQLPTDLVGDTFRCLFGANQSALESFLLERKIKGPSWIDIKKPALSSSSISWCKVEATALSPSDLSVVENLPPPPLVILSLSLKTVPNIKTHQNEIIGIAGLVHKQFAIDKPAPKPSFQNSFFAITKPGDCIFPYDLRDAMKRKGFDVEIIGSERSLLGFFLAKFLKIDPDIIIGHDMLDFVLDVFLHRLSSCKVQNWSRIGRLKKLNMPKVMGGRFADRSLTTGRLVCDIKISAKELIRCKSYDLTALTEHVLHRQRKDLPVEQIKNMYCTSDSMMWMIEHTLLDASFILDLTCELNALPLALQITNIAGNVMSRTLLGGRSERNEFLLLHAFYERGFIPPDKYYKKKQSSKAGENAPGNEGRPRKKAAYEGGLVLDPKRGFYDKFILLLDFNSLYPSIIQEYNICFTTLDQNPPEKSSELDDFIPEIPEAGLEPGVLPTEIRKLVERRKQVKQLMKASGLTKDQYIQYDIRQKALKLTANSMYGCLGFSNSRFYAKPLAALVTRQGREILMHTKELAQKMGLEVIYGDTDSIMINTNSTDMDLAFKLGNQVKAEVNKLYRLLEIDIDGVYKSLLLLKKKKYAALSVQRSADGSFTTTQELKGLDIVRRDWCDLAKLAGNYAVNQILSDQPREDIVEKIHENLQEVGTKVKNKEYDLKVFEIRKELTKDPHLYPGKDSLPHVRVALRVNSGMSKKYKSGDIVSYIICDDGTSSPATHRAYTIDELKQSEKLSVDGNYYLAQQVHPVVTRLCDPIDGTDSALIAQCLGLDPSGFKRSQTHEVDEEERLMSVQATEEEKYSGCKKFLFTCPSSGEKLEFGSGVFAETDPSWMCSLAQPCGEESSKIVVNYFAQLRNQLTLAIRERIHNYYKGWMTCDDPACGHRTRSVPTLRDHSGPICSACYKGILRPEMSYKDLYQQLCYYKLQFDVDYALNKYKQNSNSSKAGIKVGEYRRQYKTLCDVVDFYLKKSGYNEVSMASIFDWMKINEKNK
uniref:DNA polymerase n=1 Tax=Phallusia mammillata TaxID=59560 RepID=A0A6F9DNI3_9ASCI|nr:DNA polymerase alpha catalytic subunit [Phallusia mammillata]